MGTDYLKTGVVTAVVALAAISFQGHTVQARPGEYVSLPMSLAAQPGRAAALLNSRLYQRNRFRRTMGPYHCIRFYKPYWAEKAERGCYPDRRRVR